MQRKETQSRENSGTFACFFVWRRLPVLSPFSTPPLRLSLPQQRPRGSSATQAAPQARPSRKRRRRGKKSNRQQKAHQLMLLRHRLQRLSPFPLTAPRRPQRRSGAQGTAQGQRAHTLFLARLCCYRFVGRSGGRGGSAKKNEEESTTAFEDSKENEREREKEESSGRVISRTGAARGRVRGMAAASRGSSSGEEDRGRAAARSGERGRELKERKRPSFVATSSLPLLPSFTLTLSLYTLQPPPQGR